MREYEGNDLHFKITPLRENKYLSTCHHISKLSFERQREKKKNPRVHYFDDYCKSFYISLPSIFIIKYLHLVLLIHVCLNF